MVNNAGLGTFAPVDAITPELRLIIEYLDEDTVDTLQVIALELAYARDDNMELLIPAVFGEESAARKARLKMQASADRKAARWP